MTTNNNNITLKEYLLSRGINGKAKRLERKICINNEIFLIKVSKLLDEELLDLNLKEVFILAYKSMTFLKRADEFSLVYVPKNIIINGQCSLVDNTYEINLSNTILFDENKLSDKKNIFIVDSIDSNVEFQIL